MINKDFISKYPFDIPGIVYKKDYWDDNYEYEEEDDEDKDSWMSL